MTGSQHAETLIVMLVAMLALTTLARRLLVPYPIVLVLGGLVLGFIPGVEPIPLEPDLVFLVFLPPILWAAAFFTSLRDFKANLRPIALLALGLVIATTFAVAVVARALMPGLGWAPAVVLGAIVSPPDAVAATAIARRLVIPRRIIVILEGESLVNDASALILYRAAIAATVTGHFELSESLQAFTLSVVIGVAVGLAVAFAARWVMAKIHDSFSEIAITLTAPYAAWVIAERLHASSVLACVAGGIYIRRHYSLIASASSRLQAQAVWEQLIFFLNGAIFVLIGMQLGVLNEAAPGNSARGFFASLPPLALEPAPGKLGDVIVHAALISLTCVAVRFVWVPLAAWIPRWLSPKLRARDPIPPVSALFLISWTGMRGIVSLASALALPVATAAGVPFPYRSEIILITFGVVVVTLVVPGLTLAPILRRLKFPADDTHSREERHAREQASAAALKAVSDLAEEPWAHVESVERLRTYYSQRERSVSRVEIGSDENSRKRAAAYRRLRHEALAAERCRLIELRNEGVISDDVLFHLEHELDVEALRIGAGDQRLSEHA